MAFTTNALVWEAEATQTTAITGATAAQADGNFSVASTNATLTEVDNSTLKAKWYKVVVDITYSVAPDAASNIEIWIVDTDTDIGGSDSATPPTTTAQQGARRVGSVQVESSTNAQALSTVIPTFGLNKFKVVTYNDTGQSLPIGWTLKVKPLADIPKA